MRYLLEDFRYALRGLIKRPVLIVLAVLTLSLGIGTTTTIFTVLNFSLLQSIPVPNSDRLVSIYTGSPEFPYNWTPYPDYVDYRDRSSSFLGLTARSPLNVALDLHGQSDRVSGEIVSGNYFHVLRLEPAHGRLLTEQDDKPGAERVVVISHRFWMQRFGNNPSAVGSTLRINGHSFQVVGVAPKEFTAVDLGFMPAFWVPISNQDVLKSVRLQWIENRKIGWTLVLGRLKNEVKIQQAESDIRNLAGQIERAFPDTESKRVVNVTPAMPLHAALRQETRNTFRLFMGAVLLVLVIACANVANLMLTQAVGRRREMGVCLALGAPRFRLVRQYLIQSFTLSVMGAILGLSFNSIGTRLVLAYFEQGGTGNQYPEIVLDYRVFGFSILVTLLSAALFGIVPALQGSKVNLVELLKDQPVSDQRQGLLNMSFRNFLVVAQVALSVVLLITAGLLLRSLWNLQNVSPGFEKRSILLASLSIDRERYSPEEGTRFLQRLLERIGSIPGVRSVTTAPIVPLTQSFQNTRIWFPGKPKEATEIEAASVGIGYFKTMEITILQGRSFERQDIGRTPEPIVVNRALSQRLWPGKNPIGQRLLAGDSQTDPQSIREIEVVGVAANSKYLSLTESDQPLIYSFVDNSFSFRTHLLIRSGEDQAPLASSVRKVLRELDPGLAIGEIWSMEEHIRRAQWQQRLYAEMVGFLGLIGLLLAAVGVFSITNYSVRQQVYRIGIQMALGAQRSDVFKQVLRQAMRWVLVGIACGLAGALLLTRIVQSALFGIGTTDPSTYAGVITLLIIVALLAVYLPARQATKVDPLICLKQT